MSVVDDSFDHPLKLEERAAMPLAGGIMQYGFQCGMIWGAALAAGAQAYRLHGAGPKAETAAIIAAQRVVDSFQTRNKHINCIDITDLDMHNNSGILKFIIKGGPIGCFRMAANYAPIAYSEIKNAFSEELNEVPSPPVSCAAMLAQKMGVSEMQTVMAAGLAGGIGLSGGACGALGAAVWIISMKSGDQGVENIEFTPPRASAAVDQFMESSDYEFECTEIVGRKFESVKDHADYIRNGGCSKIIDVLANS